MDLTSFVRQVLSNAEPLSQNTEADNLGFGWIYYGLVRNYRPDWVIAIGSRRGFMPFCAARGLRDNERGKLLFIDPSYSGLEHPGWGGGGLWSDPEEVERRVNEHGLSGRFEHLRLESAAAFPIVKERVGCCERGVVIIDGAHTFANCLEDFELYSSLLSDGIVVFHDSIHDATEVPRAMAELRDRGAKMVTLHLDVGLTLVEISPRKSAAEAWGYLDAESDRGAQLARLLQPLLQPGDRLFDAYCGVSPLAPFLEEYALFGFDLDARCVATLKARHPRQVWRMLEEQRLPFAELPERADVLLGLGISHGYAYWDPQHALDNFRYLIGRYAPRVCFFEAARDYHDAAVLGDLKAALRQLGYAAHFEWYDSNQAAYARRKVLIARKQP
jgi:hypothetical protein